MGFSEFVKRNRHFYKSLLFWILLGVIIGTIAGIIMISLAKYSTRVKMLVKYPGDIFLRMLKCVAIPLLAACITSAIGSLDKSVSLKVGGQFLIMSFMLKLIAGILGFFGTYPFLNLRNLMKNVTYVEHRGKEERMMIDSYLDLGRNMFCRNFLEMFIYTATTHLLPPQNVTKIDTSNGTTTEVNATKPESTMPKKDISDWEFELLMTTSPNMMGIVVFSLFTGLAIKSMGPPGESFLAITKSVTKLFFLLMKWVIYTSPLCLAFLMTGSIIANDDIVNLAGDAALYLCAFLIIYSLFIAGVLPLIYFIATRKNPYRLFNGKVLLTAFSTSSSLATLPLAIEYFEEVLQYDHRIVRFVLSVGVNISKDGAVIFFTITSHLASFMNNITMTPFAVIQLFVLSLAGSVGTPGIPFGATAILWIIWVSLGFNDTADFYGTIFALDWLRDRVSTLANLHGNIFMLGILYHYNKKYLIEEEKPTQDENAVDEDNVNENEKTGQTA